MRGLFHLLSGGRRSDKDRGRDGRYRESLRDGRLDGVVRQDAVTHYR